MRKHSTTYKPYDAAVTVTRGTETFTIDNTVHNRNGTTVTVDPTGLQTGDSVTIQYVQELTPLQRDIESLKRYQSRSHDQFSRHKHKRRP